MFNSSKWLTNILMDLTYWIHIILFVATGTNHQQNNFRNERVVIEDANLLTDFSD